MKRKKNKTVIIILEILAFVLVAAGVFFGTYYMFVGKSAGSYETSIKNIVTKINETNDSSSGFIKDGAIDADKTRKDISSKAEDLAKLKEKLQGIIPTEKYKTDHDNLISGLDKNILIYRQIDAILKNPEGKDIGTAGEDLKKYRDDCMQFYSQVNLKDIKVSLSENCIKLVSSTSNYVNELVKLQRDKDIKQNQNLEFLNNLDSIISKFTPVKVDFTPQLVKVRNDKGNLDSIIDLATKNKTAMEDIQQDFASLAVPSKGITCYKFLKKALEDYSSYLNSFIYAVNNEKLLGNNAKSDEISKLYTDPSSKFNDVLKEYNDFLKSYSDFKDSSSK